MRLYCDRKFQKKGYTINNFFVGSKWLCNVLEDEDRGLTDEMTYYAVRRLKVPGKTAIPTGTYRIDMDTISPKFKNRAWAKPYGGKVPRLVGVPGFTGVLIHPGTNADSTEGCLIVGMNTEKGKVTSSQQCFHTLMKDYLIPAHNRGEEIYIEIG